MEVLVGSCQYKRCCFDQAWPGQVKTELVFGSQQEVLNKWNGHPVLYTYSDAQDWRVELSPQKDFVRFNPQTPRGKSSHLYLINSKFKKI